MPSSSSVAQVCATDLSQNRSLVSTLALAEMQSRTIGEGWKRVHQHRIDRGLPTNGRERYGYLAHRATKQRGDGAWRMCPQGCGVGECQSGFVPDSETAPIVQRIYAAYVGGKGFQARTPSTPTASRAPVWWRPGGPATRCASPGPPRQRGVPSRHRRLRQRLPGRPDHAQRALVGRRPGAAYHHGAVGGLPAAPRSAADHPDQGA